MLNSEIVRQIAMDALSERLGVEIDRPLRSRLHWYVLTSSELALLEAMCEHDPEGSYVSVSGDRLAVFSHLSPRTVRYIINGTPEQSARTGRSAQRSVPGLIERGILTELAPENAAQKLPPIYRVNEEAFTPDPAVLAYIREDQVRARTLPGISLPWRPGHPVPNKKEETGAAALRGKPLHPSNSRIPAEIAPIVALSVEEQRFSVISAPLMAVADAAPDGGSRCLPTGAAAAGVLPRTTNTGAAAASLRGQPTTNRGAAAASLPEPNKESIEELNTKPTSSSTTTVCDPESSNPAEPPPAIDRSVILAAFLEVAPSVDQPAVDKLVRDCQAKAPDCTGEEIAFFLRQKAQVPRQKNPVGFLLASVPLCFMGEAFRAWRAAERKARAHAAAAAPANRSQLNLPEDLDADAGRIAWRSILDELQPPHINPHSYDIWLRPTHGLGVSRGTLYVRVPTAEFVHIGERYGELIQGAISSSRIQLRDVQFVVIDDS
jgi:hypothetical protein